MKEPAFLICRISSEKQKDGYSLSAQKRHGLDYVERKGLNLIKMSEFIETASKVGRRQKFDAFFDEVKAYIAKSNTLVHLVAEKSDRVTRNFTNKEQLQFLVLTGKLVIHYYKDKKILDKDCSPSDIFMDDIQTAVDKYKSLNTKREVIKGMEEKASLGWFPSHAPFGYLNLRDGSLDKHGRKEAKIVEDPVRKPILIKAMQLRAFEKKDYYTIAKVLRQQGDIPKGISFTFKTAEQIFRENNLLFYSGYFKWQDKIYKGKHPTYIPSDWIELIKSYKSKKSNLKSGVGTYSHLMKCKDCGSSIIYVPKVKTLSNGEKKIYPLYWCADSKKWHRENRKKVVAINEKKLDEVFESLLTQFEIPPKVADGISKAIRVNFENYRKDQAKQLNGVKKQIRDLERKEDQLYDDYNGGVLDLEAYKRQLERVRKAKASHSLNITATQQEVVGQDFYRSADEILELAKSAKSLWKSMTPSEKQILIKKITWNQSMGASSVEFSLKKPFSVLKKMKNSGDSEKWCARVDLNHHALANTSPSSWPVYQFQHWRII